MKLNIPKRNFFVTFDGDFEFCIFLKSKGWFTLNKVLKEIQEIDKDTELNYNLLYDRISGWQKQEFIQRHNIATLGGPKYEYSFTKEALKILDRYKSNRSD